MDKLIAEFGVEKTIRRNYGYEEKFLLFKEEPTPYKAILKDGQLIAIVSRKYRLIENEKVIEVCKKIKDSLGFSKMEVIDNFPRIHVHLITKDGDGVIVHNSVDGSLALRVDLSIKIKNAYSVVRTDEIKEMYRKHVGDIKASLENLQTIISKVLEYKDAVKSAINDLEKFYVKDHKDVLEGLEDLLPKKYIQLALLSAKSKQSMTLKELYELVAYKIWNSKNIDMKRKLKLFDALNKIILLPIVLK